MIAERRSRANLGACALLLLGAVAVFFWPIVAGRVPIFRDILDSTAPLGHYIGQRLRTGHLPQWFPWDGLGLPFIGQINEGTFHPVNWLYAVLPLPAAVRWELLLGYCVAAFGQLLFARKLGLSWTASALASLGFAFCGYGISLSNVLPYLWGVAMLPWVGLFAALVCEQTRPLPWVAALALCWATIVVAGDSHSALLGGLIALFAAAHAGRLRRLPLCVLASIIAIGLAGAELLPAIDIVREGPRTAPTQNLAYLSRFWALHPHRLPELLFPGWLPSRPAHYIAAVRYGEQGMWAISIYAGAPMLALGLAGVFNRKRTALFAGALALLGLWLATGSHGGLEPLVRKLPLLNLLRYPEKYLAIFSLALPLAAAAGLDSLRERGQQTVVIVLGAAAVICALTAVWLPLDVALRIWPGLHREMVLVPQIHQAWHAGLLDAALSLAGMAVIVLGGRRHAGFLSLVPLLVFLDLWRAGGSMIVTADPRVLIETPRFCVAARREGAGPVGLRVVNVSARERRSDELEHPEIWAADSLNELRPAENALCEIGSLWNNAVLSNEPRWIRWAIGQQHLERSAALPLYGFGLVVRTDPVDPPLPNETIVDTLRVNDAETLVLVRRPAAPRAYAAVPRWVPDGASALREVEAHGLALVESPVLAGSGPAYAGTGKAGEVRIASYQPEHVVIEAEMARAGAVVLNDLAARGWTATVDGAPARIYRANVLARGVLVPEGKHHLEMTFELPRLRAGLALSGACLLLCGGLLLAGVRRRVTAAPLAMPRTAA
jgi:hypothetical protein